MKGLSTLFKAISVGIVIIGLGLIISGVINVDIFSITEIGGFVVVFSLIFLLCDSWEKRWERNKFLPFHEIEIDNLKSHLFEWIATEAYKKLIKKVVLYRAPLDSKLPIGVKYIIFFNLISNQKTKEARKVFQDLLEDKTTIFGDDFGLVYKEKPSINFHNEWLLMDKKPHGFSDKNTVLLFNVNN